MNNNNWFTKNPNKDQYWEGRMSELVNTVNSFSKYKFSLRKGPAGLTIAAYDVDDFITVRFHRKFTAGDNSGYVKVVVEAGTTGIKKAIATRLRVPLKDIDSIIDRCIENKDYLRTEDFKNTIATEDKSLGVSLLMVDSSLTTEEMMLEAEDQQFIDPLYLDALITHLLGRIDLNDWTENEDLTWPERFIDLKHTLKTYQ